MYRALDLAKYIVTTCNEDKKAISNLQLQKILYFIQKSFLKLGKQAFSDEIEAWQFGPVIPEVYYYFCGYGATPIRASYPKSSVRTEDKEIIDEIVKNKRKLNPWELVEQTHNKNGAWDKVYLDGLGNRDIIPISLIKEES